MVCAWCQVQCWPWSSAEKSGNCLAQASSKSKKFTKELDQQIKLLSEGNQLSKSQDKEILTKESNVQGWRDASEVESTDCPFRGIEFNSQQPHDGL